jgi:glycosyltransferase involved in cell wall biosynthesis
MRFLWHIHLYPPYHNCGAEYMAHCLNKFLISRGHTVRVLLRQASSNNPTGIYDIDGVTVFPPKTKMDPLYLTSDIICTHLDYTKEAILMARKWKKKCLHFVHNSSQYESILDAPEVDVVYNSQWVAEELKYKNKSFVLYPPVDYNYYQVSSSKKYITLINVDLNKGGHILAQIAHRMPDKEFLAVKGSYSATAAGQFLDYPPNVKVIENTPNILDVYKETRVLIMPSLYESWGRTATEAFCSGIPVVCSATKGLMENCDYAGIYVHDRDDIDQWVRWLKRLDYENFYNMASEKAYKRAHELDPYENMVNFERWIYGQ